MRSHEIGVSTPARHNVYVQVIGHARSCAFADVDVDIESVRFRDLPQQFLNTHNQGKKFDNFIFTEIAQLAHFSIWHRHQVSNSVGKRFIIRKEFFLRTRTKWARYAQLRQHEPASPGAIAIPGITPSGHTTTKREPACSSSTGLAD